MADFQIDGAVVSSSTIGTPLEAAYPVAPLHRPDYEIRVLCLEPGRYDSEIHCTVSPCLLDSPPFYEALSYTWGASSQQRTICFHDIDNFPVTDNLYAALKRLRRVDRDRTLWIDALCINQQDNREKSFQVVMMSIIYNRSSVLLIWLGEPQGYSQYNDVHEEVMKDLKFDKKPDVEARRLAPIRVDLALAILDTKPSWWTRVWVLQEFTCAPWPPRVCFGAHEIDLAEAKEGLWVTAPGLTLSLTLNAFDRLRKKVQGPPRDLSFLDAIIETRHLDATNPLDHIYSLLALLGANETIMVPADYIRDVSDVYLDATVSLIHKTNHLGSLYFAVLDSTRITGLPTWAADFRKRRNIASNAEYKIQPYVNSSNELSASRVFSLSVDHPSTVAQLRISPDSRLLHARGIEIDRISQIFDLRAEWFRNETTLGQNHQISPLLSALSTMKPSSLTKPFCHNQDVGSYQSNLSSLTTSPWSPKKTGAHIIEFVFRVFELWNTLNGCPMRPTQREDIWHVYKLSQFSITNSMECTSLNLFITLDGLMGFTSLSVEPEDVLALLYGSPGIATLRQKGEYYEFCGFPFVTMLEEILLYRFRHADFAFTKRSGEIGLLCKKRKDVGFGEVVFEVPETEPLDLEEREFVLC